MTSAQPAATESVDAVVVGSGFGGSVAAYRLAESGRSTVLLERGRPYPPGSFARTPYDMSRAFWDPEHALYGLFDVRSFRRLEAIVSSGLGGGSLIYANVLLRKDDRWFVHDSPLPGGGYENWPVSRDELDPHYDAVEAMLTPAPSPYADLPKSQALRDAANALGLEVVSPPLAVTFAAGPGEPPLPKQVIPEPSYGNLHGLTRLTCRLCGECDIGCNEGAKNTLDHTYLSAAAHHGADLRTLCDVVSITALDDGDYEVAYDGYGDAEPGELGRRPATRRRIRCRQLLLAAGTFGTTSLLLHNRVSLPGVSRALGTRFSGNGDLLTFLIDAHTTGRTGPTRLLDGSRGPVITTAIRVPDALDGSAPGPSSRGFYVQEAGFPEFANWLLEASQVTSSVRRAAMVASQVLAHRLGRRNDSTISAEIARLVGQGRFTSSSMPLLGMGRDVADGVITLRDGELDVDWTTWTSRAFFSQMRSTMRDIATQLHADYHDNPLWWTKRVVTVHPLGGSPMGRHPYEGVVDSYGEVFGHPGLYVVDGSAMPGPVGPNPSLTIAALADRASQRLLDRAVTVRRSAATSPAPSATPSAGSPEASASSANSVAVEGISFTEQMKGYVTLGLTDPVEGSQRARILGHRLMFELTITVSDIDVDPSAAVVARAGTATGYVHCDLLGGRLPVERSWVELFETADDDVRTRLMTYRLWFEDSSGAAITLLGRKTVRDDPGFDVWRDTSTLAVQLLRGFVPPERSGRAQQAGPAGDGSGRQDQHGEVVGAGVLRIHVLDFAKQLTTFRSVGPQGARSMTSFGGFFLDSLWQVYGRGLRGSRPATKEQP